MAALRELLVSFGIEVDDKKLSEATEKADHFIEKLWKVGKAALAAFAVKEVYEFAEGVAHTLDKIDDTAHALGISTEAVQQWGFAALAAGDDEGKLLSMMGRLQVSAVNAAKGTGEGAKAFAALGVNTKDATGKIKSADVLFEDVAEGIKNTVDPAKRAAAAVALLGRGGRELLPFLVEGRDGVRKLKEEFVALGGGFDEEAIGKGAEFEHSMAKVKIVIDGIKGAIVKGLFPVLGWIANKAALIGGWFVRMTKGTNIFRNALIMLGAILTPLAIQMAIAFAPILLATAAVAFLVLLVDDLITMFEGGESVIGDVIDKIFGKGTSADTVTAVKDAWVDIKHAFEDMWPAVKKVYEAMRWVVEHAVDLGGWIGDTQAKHDNAETEATGRAPAAGKTGVVDPTAPAWRQAQQRAELMPDFATDRINGWTAPQATADFTQYQAPDGASSITNGAPSVTINVAGTNAKPEEIAAHVDRVLQKHTRNAKHALTQAGQKP